MHRQGHFEVVDVAAVDAIKVTMTSAMIMTGRVLIGMAAMLKTGRTAVVVNTEITQIGNIE